MKSLNMERKSFWTLSVLVFAGTALCCFSACTAARSPQPETAEWINEEKDIQVNGTGIHYLVKGPADGRKVILLHGNGGSHMDLATVTEVLTKHNCLVYAPDSRGQGANPPLREYHYKDMAEDTYLFIQALKIEKPAIFGHSDGGIIALSLEILHPGTASMLMSGGANIFPEGLPEETINEWKRTEDTLVPLTKMMLHEPCISPEQLQSIACPTLIMAGSEDCIQKEHTKLIAKSIPNSQLIILDGENHSSYIMNSPIAPSLILGFLELHSDRLVSHSKKKQR